MPQKLKKEFNLMVVAGELSGDQHAAKFIQALQQSDASFNICGMGMESMRHAGVRLLADASDIAVTGFAEVIRYYPKIRRRIKQLKSELENNPPDLIILVDYPGFNLALAKFAQQLDIKVLYYISPKIWAWNFRRIKKIAQRVTMMAVIFPFEEKIFQQHHIPVRYVGHPLVDEAYRAEILPYKGDIEPRHPGPIQHILLLPGSRQSEIRQHLPLLLKTAKQLQQTRPNLEFSLLAAPGIALHHLQEAIQESGLDCKISNDVYQIAPKIDFAIATSGTVTLQLALCRVPMIIIYKPKWLTYWIAKLILKTHIGLPNILSDTLIVTEMAHYALTPEQLCDAVLAEINHPERIAAMRSALANVSQRLGHQGASENLAQLVYEMLATEKQ